MGLKTDFVNGLIKENPVLVLMIGLCPTLAVSNSAMNGLGMGIAAGFVLFCSNIVIAFVRKYTPDQIRIPIFIIIISTFVTIADYLMQAYEPGLYKQLGVFVPLIVVNCIILGRAEAFAYKNKVVSSALDGLGMGLGFTLVITVIGIVRELAGNGTVFGKPFLAANAQPVLVMILPPGGFITIGVLMAFLHFYQNKRKSRR